MTTTLSTADDQTWFSVKVLAKDGRRTLTRRHVMTPVSSVGLEVDAGRRALLRGLDD
jgi:hypothetical protein